MNSLPPELLVPIIELAAQCSSLYESYRARQKTLSALTLVNRQFHEIAQPLFPRTLYFREPSQESAFSEHCNFREVQKLADEIGSVPLLDPNPQSGDFAKLKEIRIQELALVGLASLSNLVQLERLSLERCFLTISSENYNFVFSSLKELTVEESTIFSISTNIGKDYFFSITRFPSLRALGINKVVLFPQAGDIVRRMTDLVSPSLLSRLDCFTADGIEPRGPSSLSPSSPPLPLSVSLLFNLNPRHISIPPLAPGSSLSHSHIRIRLPCERISSSEDIESALEFADKLVKESTILEELYLDLYPRNGRGGFVMGKQLAEKIEKLEEIAREKKVEIIRENHEDDWCMSLVSKEFWRRCKEKKEKQLCRE